MTQNTTSPFGLLAIALFAVTGLFGAGPVASFVDCNDSFWAVACGNDEVPAQPATSSPTNGTADATPSEVEVPEGEEIRRIDDDPVCTALDSGDFHCHT